MSDDHLVVDSSKSPPAFLCQACGLRQTLTLPMNISEVSKISSAFILEHRDCADPRFIRACTVCMNQGVRKAATNVATGKDGLQWYECDGHGPEVHLIGNPRVRLEPLSDYLLALTKDRPSTG